MRASPVTAQRFKRRRRMTQYDASNSSSSECTVANVTFGFDPGERKEAQSRRSRRRRRGRHNRRLQRLRAHHNACEERYEKALTFRLGEEKELTWDLNRNLTTKKVNEGSSDSDGTIILSPAPAAVEDTSVPELRRTDSVILKRKGHGYEIIESVHAEYSAGEYFPSSDSSAEEDKQHKDKQKGVKRTNPVNSSSSDSPDEDPAPRPLEQGQLSEFKGQIQADPPEIIVVDSDESNTEDEGYVTMQKDEQPVSSPTITSSGLPGSSKSCDKKRKSRLTKKSSVEGGQMTDHHSAEDRMEEKSLSKKASGESSTAKGL